MGISGDVSDYQLMRYATIQIIWQNHREVLRREGIEKRGSEEPLQSIPLPCTQSGLTIPSYPSSEMRLGKLSDQTEVQSWIVNFRTEVCSRATNPMLALQWIKEIEVAKSLDDLITPKSRPGKHFPDYEELDLMMAAALKRCYDK